MAVHILNICGNGIIYFIEFYFKIIKNFQISFKEYGPVFKIQILDRIIVHTIEPEAIREGLVERNYPKVPKFCKAISYPLNLRFNFVVKFIFTNFHYLIPF